MSNTHHGVNKLKARHA